MELLRRQAAACAEVAPRGLHHHGRAAGIDLVLREVGQVGHDRLVDQAGAAAPAVLRSRLGQHGDVAQVRHLGGGLLGPVAQVEVGAAAAAPVQHRLAVDALEAHVLEDGLDRGEARSRGQQHHWPLGGLAQVEAAEGSLDAQDVLLLHRAEDWVGEAAARHVAQVQLQPQSLLDAVRRAGHRVAAPQPAGQDELHVLAGVVAQLDIGGQLQGHDHHVGRGALKAAHAAGHLLHRELARARHGARLDHEVGLGRGAAGQHEAGLLLGHAQGLELVGAVDHPALQEPTLAGAAGAIAAAIGQADALADGGREHRLVARHPEAAPARLQRHLERHWVSSKPMETGFGQGAVPAGAGIVPAWPVPPIAVASTLCRA